MHHAATSHPAPADTCHLKKIKKKSENGGFRRVGAHTGGVPLPARLDTPDIHTPRTPPQYTARRQTPARLHLHAPHAPYLRARRPSARKQPATHQHTRQPTPRKALTWHHMAKATHLQGKTAHPMQCRAKVAHPKRRRASRAFSLFRVLYKYYLYTYAKRKKIKSFPRHIHGVKRLFAARQNRAFPGVLFGKLWDSPWVRFEAHRSHGKGIYTHVGWRMYSGQVSSI